MGSDYQLDRHLEFVQGAINRLASNSFMLKGWSITLVAALFALAASQSKQSFAFLAYLPAAVFWGLDGYFLAQERLFRRLYAAVAERHERVPAYSLDTAPFEGEESWVKATLSPTLIPFHGVLLAAIVGTQLWLPW